MAILRVPFHAGERALQQRAGLRERMAIVGARVIRDHLPDQHREFFAQLPFLVVGSLDADGQPWTSLLHAVDWDLKTNTLRGGADPRNPPGAATISRPRPAAKRKAKAEAEVQP